MKRKTGLSLMLALLMILSTLVVVTPSGASSEIFVVEKQVSNGEGWYDSIHAVYGDIVQFKITIAYNGEDCVKNIVATDTLPPCLEYVETLKPEDIEPIMNGNVLVWNLGETYLEQYCSTDIIFEAKVVGIGENINKVNVTAVECCPDHNIYGVATATVIVDPSVDVEKKVWDPDAKAWVEELSWVIKGENVRFQITSTYHGDIPMKCMLVKDFLPECCLEYANNVYIKIAGEEVSKNDTRYPDITVSDDIRFDWKSADFYLENGESVVIEFDAKVINYCGETVKNYACARLGGCYLCNPDNYVYGWDTATIQCVPHDLIFEKTVLNGKVWEEKTSVYVNDAVRFKIELTYYGNENLTDIKIVDELPCVLKYVGNEKVKIVHSADQAIEILEIDGTVSEDKKTIWWNLTNELSDRDTLSIEFDALATGITGDCGDCGINTASYTGYSNGNDYSGSNTAQISSTHQPPAPPAKLTITIKRFSIGHIQANIKNVGETGVSFVKWSMTAKGGILKKINAKAGGTLSDIDAGSSRSISSGKRSIKHGFGRIIITITVTVGEKTFEKKANGFVIGRLIIVR